jgi:hypothetical protein
MPTPRRCRFAAAVVAFAGLAVACSGGTQEYGRSTEVPFIAACAAGDADAGAVCRCTYEQIVKTIPFDRYVELDHQMQDNPKLVPDEIRTLAVGCSIKLNLSKLPNGFGAHLGTESDSTTSDSSSSTSS